MKNPGVLFKIIDIGDDYLTIKVTLNSGKSMNYHSHLYRDEVWTIVSGRGKVILDGAAQNVAPGDVIEIPKLSKHTVTADSELRIVEVQLGKDISIEDKIKHRLPRHLL